MKILVTAIMAIISMTANAQETRLLAFPTAEGFGKYASGGRGGKVRRILLPRICKEPATQIFRIRYIHGI